MKAAVMYQRGEAPRYADFPEPNAQHDNELVLSVKAAAIKNLDRSQASGTHYASSAEAEQLAQVIGGDAVGELTDGTRVFALGIGGTVAEKALIDRRRMVPLPANINYATAAALPNAVAGAAMALRFRAGMQPGETVLINGATGVTGRMAVQLAKHYGAKHIIATGRNPESLKALLALGADEVISLRQDDVALAAQFQELHARTSIDVIIDYLWGHSAEMLLLSLKGTGGFTHRVRFVSVGTVAGDIVRLSGAILRSVDLQLSGSGLGSWSRQEMGLLITEILPETLQLAANGKLRIDTITVALPDIERLWDMRVPDGQRLVVLV